MARGGPRPGSGRPRGSRNRRTVEMTERLDRMGLDPIAALARLAQHAEAEGDLTLAEKCWRGLLPYAGPKPTPPAGFSAQVSPQPASAPAVAAVELPSWWRPTGRAS